MPGILNLNGLALSTEQGRLRRTAQRLARETLAPDAARIDREGVFPRENLRAIAAEGLLALSLPREHGGGGAGVQTVSLVIEELARGCASTAMCYNMHMATLPLIGAAASPAQVQALVAPIARGEALGSFAMSEPGSGNRLWHTDSHAVQEGDCFVVDCLKSFATSAGQADYYLVPTRSDPAAGPNDLSLFMIDGRDENIHPLGTWDGMGLRGNSSTPVRFDRCRVPAGRRLGDPRCGFSLLFAYSLPTYHVGLAAVYLGLAQSAMDAAVEHVRRRVHTDTGQTLAQLETVQRYVAEMRLKVDLVRSMIFRVGQMADNATALFDEFSAAGLLDDVIRANPDDPFFIEVAQVKTAACEMAVEVTHRALQVCGGTAYRRGHPVERAYRDARAGSLMAPADDTLKIIVGRQVLGLPQPWG